MKFEKITNITTIPNEDVYFMHVKNNHNFFGNGVCLHNCGYRGSLNVLIYNFGKNDHTFEIGDRVAQMKVEKVWPSTVEFIDDVVDSKRGDKGLGSSGK